MRRNNQDQFVVAKIERQTSIVTSSLEPEIEPTLEDHQISLLCAVADGVGGTDEGRMASSTAIQSLVKRVSLVAATTAEANMLEQLEDAVAAANEAVVKLTEPGTTAATTLTLALLVGSRAYILHVGDSRLYWLRNGEHNPELKLVTHDQTLGERMIDTGTLAESELSRSRFRNVLVQALGAKSAVPTVLIVDPQPGDALLLCSDGLTGHVSDAELEENLRASQPAEHTCEHLIERAKAEGGLDNITLVLARYLKEESGEIEL